MGSDTMNKKRYIGNKHVSRIGFGAWPLGNSAHGKTMSIEEGVTLVKKAVQAGITFFDTAPNYANGRSETILGEALKASREDVVINTKFGHHPDGTIDFNEEKIIPSIEGSLSRLQTDYLDSVLLHNPAMNILKGKTEHFKILEALKERGTIKGYGVSVDTAEELDAVLSNSRVDVIELMANVFFQSTREYFEKIAAHNIALIIKVPLDSGWLTGKYSASSTFQDIRARWTKADMSRRDVLVNTLKRQLNTKDLLPYAMGFLWSYDAITTVIPGIRNQAQLESHLKAMETPFPKNLKEELEAFYDVHIASNPLPW